MSKPLQIRVRRLLSSLLIIAGVNLAVLLIAVAVLLVAKGDYLAGIRSRLFARGGSTTVQSSLTVDLPRGWERVDQEIRFYSFTSELIASMKIGDSSFSRRFSHYDTDVRDVGKWCAIDIGGVNGAYRITPVPGRPDLPVHVLISIPDKDMFMRFIGPAGNWETWRQLLENAKWREQKAAVRTQQGTAGQDLSAGSLADPP